MRELKGEWIGLMRDQIVFEKKDVSPTINETGERETTWSTESTVFGRMDFRLRGSESYIMGLQMSPQTTVVLTIYNKTGLNTIDYRVYFGGQTYRIDSILSIEGNRLLQLELIATERDAER